LQADLVIRKGFSIVDSRLETVGFQTAPQTAFYKYTIPGSRTKDYAPSLLGVRDYKVEYQWICDGVELGKDGCPPNTGECTDETGTTPSSFNFAILVATKPPVEEDLCKIQSGCQTGYKLENPDQTNCFCSKQFQCGNGICEIGESSFLCPEDCGVITQCPSGFILIDGVCGNPNNICIKDGGNVDCSKPPVNGDDNGDNGDGLDLDTSKIFFYLILIVGEILIIIGGRKFLKS